MSKEGEERALLELAGALIAEVGDGRGLGRLHLEASLEKDLGLGSLERVELFARAEGIFGVRLPEEALGEADTLGRLLTHIRARRDGTQVPGAAPRPAAAPDAAEAPVKVELPRGLPSPTPDKARTLVEVLEYRALRDKDRVHMILVKEDGSEEALTYGALRKEAGAIAEALRDLGLRPKGTVAIMLPTSRGYFAAFMGTLLAGGIPVPLYPPFRLDRIAEYIEREARIIENAGAEILLTFDRAARVADLTKDRVRSVKHVVSIEAITAKALAASASAGSFAAAVTGDDTALLQYTSGSTGDPKGVELTHANVIANIRASGGGCELDPATDVMVSWLPLYHDMGLIGGWLMNFYYGNPTVILSPVTFLARPETWLHAMTRHKGTISVAPNFAFELCTRRISDEAMKTMDLSSMRALLNGSEPIHPPTLDRFVERFAKVGYKRTAVFCAYGLAENMVGVTMPRTNTPPTIDVIDRKTFEQEGRAVPVAPETKDALQFVGVGYAMPTNEVRIAGEDGATLPPRRQGRLLFRGPSAFKGYFRNPEATAKVKLADGWNDSGDLAYMAEDGHFFITGRSKDLIIKGGRNYYPHEIEAAASGVAGVRSGCCAAFALKDEAAGTELIVIVAETKETGAAAREALSGKIGEAIATAIGAPPDRVVLAPPGAVPKTSSGKIRRSDTKKLYLAGELSKTHGSFARQAAGLYLGSLPTRVMDVAKKAAGAIYGAYAMSTFLSSMGLFTALGHVTPSGRPLRWMSWANATFTLGLTGLRPKLIGAEKFPEGAAVLVANHASYLDPYVFNAALPVDVRYVVKGECRESKIFGPLVRRADHILVERHAAERSVEDLKEIVAHLARGEKVLIFPEGTFLREVGLRPFKLGAFRVACEAGVPVVPIALRGTRRCFRDGDWLPKHVALEAEVLDPILPSGKGIADFVRLRDRAAAAIASRLDEPRMGVVAVDDPSATPGPSEG